MNRRLSFLLLLPMVVAGCTGGTVYSHYRHIADEEWGRSDTLIYLIPDIPDSGMYDLGVGLRTTNSYPYSNLTLIIEQETHTSDQHVTDTFSISLTSHDTPSQQDGTGVALRQYHFPLKQLSLAEGDTLRLTLRHDMQRDPLPGIADVGVTLHH